MVTAEPILFSFTVKILIGIGKIREGQPNKVSYILVLLLKLMRIFTVHINLNSRKINNKYAILNIKTGPG